jgi:Tfp pilus assembly protein PilP
MKRTACIFIILAFLIPIGGCKKEQPAVKKPMAQKVRPAGKKTAEESAKAEKAAVAAYDYSSKGRRDPFLPLIITEKRKPVKKKGASPFESYDIDEIKLMAIASDERDKHYALIKLPNNKTYTITEGMTLGLLGGKVEKITMDSVVIREYVKDYRGEIKPRDTILKLHKGEE